MSQAKPAPFDPSVLFSKLRQPWHGGVIGTRYHDHGADWCDLAIPYDERLIGDPTTGVIASGPILALMDMAGSTAAWLKRGAIVPHATLALRIDYLRPARAGETVVGHGECYHITRSISFVRGHAHDGDPDDPLAHVACTYMLLDDPE